MNYAAGLLGSEAAGSRMRFMPVPKQVKESRLYWQCGAFKHIQFSLLMSHCSCTITLMFTYAIIHAHIRTHKVTLLLPGHTSSGRVWIFPLSLTHTWTKAYIYGNGLSILSVQIIVSACRQSVTCGLLKGLPLLV
jgi:hypothetical protein